MDRRVSPANSYMEHFAYLSNLWMGEMYDYDLPPDYWLIEISGIPFGLTSEMLNYENGGNPYRSMVYGMTGRLHPSAAAMWRFWDAFGIQDSEMLGYWSPKCPVTTNRADVRATVYRKPGKALIAVAHWPCPRGGGRRRGRRRAGGIEDRLERAGDRARPCAARDASHRAFPGAGSVPGGCPHSVRAGRRAVARC